MCCGGLEEVIRYLSPMGESSFSVGHEDGRGDGAEGEY